ncbi:hypothetical protein J0X14_14235 [Muricauda sp. CAU 1633]|uniref:hypothetical protein n=1 Tax=Allomuricauda sp. CAU 1633 TaxID=2816036 RepID=UPI001A90207F|nr:hypothetical protein [Muricauda sp. CAU 1633]MBO0323463.1 hypothetical protein [Muricauda sp. CAU 1633]
MSYSTVCDAEEAGRLKGTARASKAQSGAEQELFWSPNDFSFADKDSATTLADWNTAVAAGNLYYIGVIEEFDSNDTEPTYYESPNGNLRLKTANAKRVRQYRLVECACTHAALLSFDAQNGRLFMRTSKGYLKARLEDDGTVRGFKTTQFDVGLRTAATADAPGFTPIDVTFETPFDDDKDIFEDSIDFEFSQVDQIYNAEFAISSVASDGSNLTFTLTATKDCTNVALSGLTTSHLIFKDANGAELATVSMPETGSTGVYSVDITTAETVAYAEIYGVQTVSSINYVSDQYKAST